MSIAITFSEYGAPEVLRPTEVPPPEPGPGQVRIKVRAASVNPLDMKIRSGLMDKAVPARFPVTPGLDAAGVVDAVGEGADAAVGDEVLGVTVGGSYAEYALLERPVAKPEGLSWEVAASLVTVGLTAHPAELLPPPVEASDEEIEGALALMDTLTRDTLEAPTARTAVPGHGFHPRHRPAPHGPARHTPGRTAFRAVPRTLFRPP
ncbi:alcohol dehydrogenase catalytic domain-containing protein, partial [Streptomyces sp. NPDC049099]|uniref:alcohol dehydrogenase catalytic domain-containing protein n=1 Tax=Streptomyces sp. NPDC049099 TaxID=3155768 RepID=UPI00341E48D5